MNTSLSTSLPAVAASPHAQAQGSIGSVMAKVLLSIQDVEVDIEGTDFLVARVGRIGRQYFEVDADTQACTCLGWFDSPEAAAQAAAGADFVYRLL